MSAQIYLLRKFRCQNLLVRRSMPTLFVVVCFLIIANTRCDSVGSANVQKFHPNGRYGRRSVSSLVDQSSHTELGKLNQREPLKSFLNSFDSASYSSSKDEANLRFPTSSHQVQQSQAAKDDSFDFGSEGSSSMRANLEQELNKLLKCNYTGVSNLYWCDTGN